MMNISFQKENSDEEMMATIDPETEEYGKDILAIVGFIVILIIWVFVGNGFLFGIFIYEKYGIGKKHALNTQFLIVHSSKSLSCLELNSS